jgi:hypothetical protein
MVTPPPGSPVLASALTSSGRSDQVTAERRDQGRLIERLPQVGISTDDGQQTGDGHVNPHVGSTKGPQPGTAGLLACWPVRLTDAARDVSSLRPRHGQPGQNDAAAVVP